VITRHWNAARRHGFPGARQSTGYDFRETRTRASASIPCAIVRVGRLPAWHAAPRRAAQAIQVDRVLLRYARIALATRDVETRIETLR
jgi:hypothetical protein